MEQFLTELNKSQLDKGLDASGNFLGSYKPATYEYAKSKGRPKTQPDINLLDTGAFRKSFMASVNGNSLLIAAFDGKTSMLERAYGESILGLPIDKKEIVANKLIEILTKKVTNVLTNA
jgi:hypothetical protein